MEKKNDKKIKKVICKKKQMNTNVKKEKTEKNANTCNEKNMNFLKKSVKRNC